MFTCDHQVKKALESVKQTKHLQSVSHPHTRINIIIKYCRLHTIQYSQPCGCTYNSSNNSFMMNEKQTVVVLCKQVKQDLHLGERFLSQMPAEEFG